LPRNYKTFKLRLSDVKNSLCLSRVSRFTRNTIFVRGNGASGFCFCQGVQKIIKNQKISFIYELFYGIKLKLFLRRSPKYRIANFGYTSTNAIPLHAPRKGERKGSPVRVYNSKIKNYFIPSIAGIWWIVKRRSIRNPLRKHERFSDPAIRWRHDDGADSDVFGVRTRDTKGIAADPRRSSRARAERRAGGRRERHEQLLAAPSAEYIRWRQRLPARVARKMFAQDSRDAVVVVITIIITIIVVTAASRVCMCVPLPRRLSSSPHLISPKLLYPDTVAAITRPPPAATRNRSSRPLQ